MMRCALRLAVAMLLAAPASAQPMPPPLPPERVFSGPDLAGSQVKGANLAPTGGKVAFLQPGPDDPESLDLWVAPLAADAPARRLVSAASVGAGPPTTEEEAARRERQRQTAGGIVEYQWRPDGQALLIPTATGLHIADAGSGKVRLRIPAGNGALTDARFSPEGKHLSWIADGTLMVALAAAGAPRAISPAGTAGVQFGVAEFVAQEEFARDTGYWWSPDEQAIAYTRVDESGVTTLTRATFPGGQAKVVSQRFPLAGTANAKVDLFVQPLAGGAPVRIDLGPDPDIYLLRVHWSKDGRTLYAERQSRDQTRLDLLAADPSTGATRILLTEARKPWVNSTRDFRALGDGGFLWVSERNGFRHLYRYDRNGRLVAQLTDGSFPLGGFDRQPSLLGVDEPRGKAYVLASAETPIERHVYEVAIDRPGPMRRVTEGAGWWTPVMAADASAFIGTFSNWETPPQTAIYAPDGSRLRWLSENRLAAGHPYHPYRAGLPRPEFGTLAAEDGQIMHHVLLKPPGFDPKRRYPVIVEVYGGPGRQHVMNSWRVPTERLFLEAGYLYFKLDNRGSANRGLGFEGVIAGRLGTPEVADQIRGLRHLQSLPFVDPDRVGVMGWSYGGFMTLRLLTEPGAGFRAGAAGASPADFRQYDTHYTERFLGKPQDNPAAYDAAAILPRLDRLEGRLLLIHGMADDNVVFDNAAGMMSRLQVLRKPFDLMLYPDEKHAVQAPSGREHLWRTQKEFFDRALAPREAKP